MPASHCHNVDSQWTHYLAHFQNRDWLWVNRAIHVCIIGQSENDIAASASDWLRHFRLLLWTAERNSTNLDRKQYSSVLYQVCVIQADRKIKMARPVIGWAIFDFSSETAKRNSTRLYRNPDLNIIYQVCVFRADRKNNMDILVSDWLRHYRLLLWNRWPEFNETLSKISMSWLVCIFRADRNGSYDFLLA